MNPCLHYVDRHVKYPSSTWICPLFDLMLCHRGRGRGGAQEFSHGSSVSRPELKGTHARTHTSLMT